MKKFFLLVSTLLLSVAVNANPLAEEELLEPEKAFRSALTVVDGETVAATWNIADGYYLYREKFQFESLTPGVQIKATDVPPGKKKTDEFFGEVETYRKAVKISLKLARDEASAQTAKFKVTSQGCADVGVCYQPQVQTVDLKLPATTPAANQELDKVGSLAALGDLISPAQQEFLEPEKAFAFSVTALDATTLHARIDIADGYYLYRDKTRFEAHGAAKLLDYTLPVGKEKQDEFFGKTEVYYGQLDVRLPLTRQSSAASAIEFAASFQGCAEKGICYPPTTKKVTLQLPEATAAAAAARTSTTGSTMTRNYALAVLIAFGTGLLLTFTPCVLPMIPILSSIIVGQGGQNITKTRGGILSVAYVLGTAVTYTAAGVLAGASGDQLQAYFQNPWAIGTFSFLFVLLAMSMFGFYDLQMPSSIQSRLQSGTRKFRGGSLLGVFLVGLVSALIVGACVSPLLISALGVAIASKDPVLGGLIMFSMSLGMGVILIAVGVGAGFLLPRAGGWMNTVKYVFGVLLLAVAIYLLGAIPQVPVLLLWGALFIVVAVYLGATQSLPQGARGWDYLWKGVGTFLLVWGVLALLGGLAGNRDVLNPLPVAALGLHAPAVTQGDQPAATQGTKAELFHRVTTVEQLNEQLAAAKAAGKPVILDFYATWCTDCLRMERSTFADARVRQEMGRFLLIQADVSENNEQTRRLKQAVGVFGPPALLFYDAKGEEQSELRFYGYKSADSFLSVLARIA